MAIDRGELRYSIIAQDRFRNTFRRFRREVDDARRALDEFERARRRASTSTGGNDAATRASREQADAAREAARARREETDRLRELNARIKERERIERDLGRINRQATRDRQQAAASEARALAQSERAQRRALDAARQQRRELLGLNREGNRLLFTFRRLVGALAAFALARQAVSSFRDLVSLGVRFNAELQTTRVGFAGIIASAGRITDLQGRQLRGQEAFNAAIQAGERVQRTLLVRSLETTATVSELGVAFQQAVGPGLARGLNIDQISELSVLISQAATSINLSQQQLAEETRSILSGTARAQTTRLAALFGGAAELNQLVRTARDGNELFAQLQDRLGGTAEAARRIANEIPGLANRIRGALEVVTGAAAVDFSETLRTTLQDIFDTLVQVNEQTGLLEPNPQVLAAFGIIFDTLDGIVAKFRELAGNIGLDGLASVAQVIATALDAAASAVIGVVQGARDAFRIISSILSPVLQIAAALGLTDNNAQDLVSTLTRLLTILAIARAGAALLAGGFGRITTAVSVLLGPLSQVLLLIGKIPGSLFQVTSVITALAFGFRALVSEILGVNATFGDVGRILALTFENAFGTIIRQGEISFKQFANNIVGFFTDPIATLARLFADLLGAVAGGAAVAANLGLISEDSRVAFDDAISRAEQLARIRGGAENPFLPFSQQEIDKQRVDLQDFIESSKQEFADLAADIARRQANDEFNPLPDPDSSDIEARAKALLDRFRAAFGQAQEQDGGLPFNIGARNDQVTLQQQQQLQQAQAQSAVLQQQAATESELVRLQQSRATSSQQELAAARGKLATLFIERQNRIQAAALAEQELQRELSAANGAEARANIQGRINALRTEESAQFQIATAEIQKQQREVEKLALLIDEGLTGGVSNFAAGFAEGLRGFAERFASAFQAGVEIAQGIVQRFSSFVSDSVVDALDPTQDFDLRERFARFLQDIARLILQQLTQLAIAKAILGLGIGGLSGGGGVGLAAGGPVTVPNFAEGGNVPGGPSFESRPPPGAPKSDTVLARLTPGEWVDPVHTVARLGADFFDRLRMGAGDPGALRALVGLGARARAKKAGRSGPFFQGGGLVSEQLRQVREASERQAAAAARTGSSSEDSGGLVAALPATNATMERLIAGGKGALLRFMAKNSDNIGGTSSSRTRR